MNKLIVLEQITNCLFAVTMFICAVALLCLISITVENESLSDFSVEVEVMCE